MFTGIVTAVGVIAAVEPGRAASRLVVDAGYDPSTIAEGASIAHAGCCLTVLNVCSGERGARWSADVSSETLAKTTLGTWRPGATINLERSMRLGDELGGHLVTGHVDGLGRLITAAMVDGAWSLRFEAPESLASFIATKGSIAVDGVSLTVNRVDGAVFDVMIIPHTAEVTTLGALVEGDKVNLEIDLVARYVARLTETRA